MISDSFIKTDTDIDAKSGQAVLLYAGGRRQSEFGLECLREIIDIAVSADVSDFRDGKTAVHQQTSRILQPVGDQILFRRGTETLLKQFFIIGKADPGHLCQNRAVKIRIKIMLFKIDDGVFYQTVFAVRKITGGICLAQRGNDFIKIRHEACFIHACKTITLNHLSNMASCDVSKYLNWKSTDDKTSK